MLSFLSSQEGRISLANATEAKNSTWARTMYRNQHAPGRDSLVRVARQTTGFTGAAEAGTSTCSKVSKAKEIAETPGAH